MESLTLLEGRPDELGKQLRGRLQGLWSYRVGNYRILYTIEGTGRRSRVIVRAIRHRAVAYPPRRRPS
jgi:mRNA-degrading endonuclease RelE of RelBE toxin-antitoxin system